MRFPWVGAANTACRRPDPASRARAFVRLHLGEHLLSYLTDDVDLVVSELATNAMVHARTTFRVSLQAFEATLLLEVEGGRSEKGGR